MSSNIIVVRRCDFCIGQSIGGRYMVEEILGEGAFGKVFKVRESGIEYAFKLLKLWEIMPELRKPIIDRFKMEFETGQIKSEFLVKTLDCGLVYGNPYIVMEYCSKGNLAQYIKHNRVNMTDVAWHILCGLHDLHRNGKVHRDLKPENVLIKANGTFALTDFGISGDRNKRMTEKNLFGRPQQIFGTYAYMPPEQVNRKRGDATVLPTTDIFSFGVVMYQLITGKLPFGELNTHEDLIIYQQKIKDGKWDKNQITKLPDGKLWETIISGCLIPDFKYRLQSVSDVLKLLPKGYNNLGILKQQKPYSRQTNYNIIIRIMQGKDYGRVYDLKRSLKGNRVLTIGRDSENSICIHGEETHISRRHCTLETDESYKKWFIRDGQWISEDGNKKGTWYESVNGTFVNSKRITKAGMELETGNIITIGYTTLRIEKVFNNLK